MARNATTTLSIPKSVTVTTSIRPSTTIPQLTTTTLTFLPSTTSVELAPTSAIPTTFITTTSTSATLVTSTTSSISLVSSSTLISSTISTTFESTFIASPTLSPGLASSSTSPASSLTHTAIIVGVGVAALVASIITLGIFAMYRSKKREQTDVLLNSIKPIDLKKSEKHLSRGLPLSMMEADIPNRLGTASPSMKNARKQNGHAYSSSSENSK